MTGRKAVALCRPLCWTLCLIASSVACVEAQTAPVNRRESGSLIYDNIPEIPASLNAGLHRYENTRSAVFEDWLADGSMLILTRFGEAPQLHRVGRPGGARQQLTFVDEPISGVAVEPQTNRYVYGHDTGGDEYFQLYRGGRGGPDLRITEPGTRNESLVFSHDGKLLAWSRLSQGDPDWDIMLMDPSVASSRRVVLEGRGSMSPLDISPDGRQILIERYISSIESERWLLDIATGRLRNLFPEGKQIACGGGEFTPDGIKVILTTNAGADVQRLVELDLRNGRMKPLTQPLRWDVEAFDLTSDGKRLAYSINEDGYSGVVVRDLPSGKAMQPPQLPRGVLTGLKFSPNGTELAISLSLPASGGDAWSWNIENNALTRWTNSELGGLDPASMVEPSLVRVRSFDGLKIPVFVYRPRNARGKVPVIVKIHGGPEGQARPAFNSTFQYWANELGAAVVFPNVRGSDGYGKTWLALDNAEKREDSVRDIGAVLDWIATQKDFDASRVVVHGASYGGYMVLSSLMHYADRLAGAVDIVGISNFVTFLTHTEGYRRDLRRAEYGDERDPRMREVLERISPRNHTGRMTRPLLVFQGENDPRVRKSESDRIVSEVREHGVEVWYLVARDEGHGFRKKHNEDAQREVEALFLRKVFGSTGH